MRYGIAVRGRKQVVRREKIIAADGVCAESNATRGCSPRNGGGLGAKQGDDGDENRVSDCCTRL